MTSVKTHRIDVAVQETEFEMIKEAAGQVPVKHWVQQAALLMAQWTKDDPDDVARLAEEVQEVQEARPAVSAAAETAPAVCGGCQFFHATDGQWGDCHAHPPTVVPHPDASWHTIRPEVRDQDGACSVYREGGATVAAVAPPALAEAPPTIVDEPLVEAPDPDEPEFVRPVPSSKAMQRETNSARDAAEVIGFLKTVPDGKFLSITDIGLGLLKPLSEFRVRRALHHLETLELVSRHRGPGRSYLWKQTRD